MFRKKPYTVSTGKELVTLRKRAMKDGGYSLLLDYQIDGVRTREFLKMYLVPEVTKIDEIQNQETLKAANLMKTRRIVEIQSGKAGIKKKNGKNMLLSKYLEQQYDRYMEAGKTKYAPNIDKLKNWINKYNSHITLKTIDRDYLIGFVKYMKDGGLAPGTIHMYYSNLNTMLNNAYRDDLIDENPFRKVALQDRPKKPESTREYLTFDEVQKLINTKCGNDQVKRAFLFACFTGLRLIDVENLQWSKIKRSGAGYQVEERQQKTGKIVYVPLSSNARRWLPKARTKKGQVFPGLPTRATLNEVIDNWVKRAKINKHITFHCSRHTYGTLLITYGADIYTVSSLMGHKDISTTQIYAKIIDKKKTDAVDMIPSLG